MHALLMRTQGWDLETCDAPTGSSSSSPLALREGDQAAPADRWSLDHSLHDINTFPLSHKNRGWCRNNSQQVLVFFSAPAPALPLFLLLQLTTFTLLAQS
jgi:hypothetical protein